MAASNTILAKPVMRLISVAKAIPHALDATAASVSSGRRPAVGGGGRRRPPVLGIRGAGGGAARGRSYRGSCAGRPGGRQLPPVTRVPGGRGQPVRAGRGSGATAVGRPTAPAPPTRPS